MFCRKGRFIQPGLPGVQNRKRLHMAKTEHPTCPAGFKTSIGGQAIIEGVMMKGPKKTVMSVRKPDGSIVQEGWDNPPRRWYQKVPLVRGIASFILSLTDGYKCLMRSAELATDGIEDENPSKFDKWLEEKFGDKLVKAVGYISMVLGLCIAALLFMYLPAQIVTLLREAGATEIHMRSSAPPFIAPCYFGTDIPDRDSLIACRYSVEEIRALIGADSLGFLSLEALHQIAPDAACGFCDGCFTGAYPIAT